MRKRRPAPDEELNCMCRWFPLITILVPWLIVCFSPAHGQTAAEREYYLNSLIYPQKYTPAKNSFIFQNLKRGERKTLADIKGNGSLRHLWTTWARSFDQNAIAEDGKVMLLVFVDGEKTPGFSGTVDELFRAAEATGYRYVPEPAFNYEGAFNLYLPIFFRTGLRVEIEALDNLEEFYAQLDYRTTSQSESSARLISEKTAAGVTVKYVGRGAPSFGLSKSAGKEPPWRSGEVTIPAGDEQEVLQVFGRGILRGFTVESKNVEDLHLLAFWDNMTTPAVSVPLKNFGGGFNTLAVQSKPGSFTCYFPMPFRKRARIRLRNRGSQTAEMTIRYSLERDVQLPSEFRYFRAQFRDSEETNGYRDFNILNARGEGHFVGLGLFDSGHNHGGGDTALIDGDTAKPLVLHGIAGEDYFSFAWHKTGRMHAFAGAPQHERRYRFHLEQPYPFHSSILFNFAVFAGLRPRAVAFWYEHPSPRSGGDWTTLDGQWNVIGPLDEKSTFPRQVDGGSYQAEVTLDRLETFTASSRVANMTSGFLDLTHHYRHFLTTSKGTGFVAGNCKAKAITYVYSAKDRSVDVLIGHDDLLELSLNDEQNITLPEQPGFNTDRVTLKLRRGWNKLSGVIHNTENINWRWYGISLAFKGSPNSLRDIKFAAVTGK